MGLRIANLQWHKARESAWKNSHGDFTDRLQTWARGRAEELFPLIDNNRQFSTWTSSGSLVPNNLLRGLRTMGMTDDPAVVTRETLQRYFADVFFPNFTDNNGLEALAKVFFRAGTLDKYISRIKYVNQVSEQIQALEIVLTPILGEDAYRSLERAILSRVFKIEKQREKARERRMQRETTTPQTRISPNTSIATSPRVSTQTVGTAINADSQRQVRPSEDARNAAASQQPRHELPPGLQVKPSLSPGQDVHPPEYYTGARSRYPYLPPSLRTNLSGSDIHPPGYHGGGGGPYMPPMFRTGGR